MKTLVMGQLAEPERFQQSPLGGCEPPALQQSVSHFDPGLRFGCDIELSTRSIDSLLKQLICTVPVLLRHLNQRRLDQETRAELCARGRREFQTPLRGFRGRLELSHFEI